jgi:hypothetical protein
MIRAYSRRTVSGIIILALLAVVTSCGVPAVFKPGRPGTGYMPGYVNGAVHVEWPKDAASTITEFKIVVRLQSAPKPGAPEPDKWTTQNSITYTEILDIYRINAVCIPGQFWRIQYRATSWSKDGKATTGSQDGPARLIKSCP